VFDKTFVSEIMASHSIGQTEWKLSVLEGERHKLNGNVKGIALLSTDPSAYFRSDGVAVWGAH